MTVRGSSGHSAKNRWHGILEPHYYLLLTVPQWLLQGKIFERRSLCAQKWLRMPVSRRGSKCQSQKGSERPSPTLDKEMKLLTGVRDFPGGPVFKNLPCNAWDLGSIPGQKTKIPHAAGQLTRMPLERNNLGLMLPNKQINT